MSQTPAAPGIGAVIRVEPRPFDAPLATTAPTPPAPPKYLVGPADGVFALLALLLGYLWWDWLLPRDGATVVHNQQTAGGGTGVASATTYLPNVAVTAFFLLAFAVSVAYYRVQRVRLDARAWVWAGAVLVASLPFVLYQATPVHVFLGMGLLVGFVLWHAYVSGSAQTRRLDDGLVVDALNQGFCTPWHSVGAWWAGLGRLRRGGRGGVAAGVLGVLVALPLIVVVVSLLISADQTFATAANHVITVLTRLNLFSIVGKLIVAIPVAVGIFAQWYAHSRRHETVTLTRDSMSRGAAALRRIQPLALAAPTAVLCLIYLGFFAAMSTYLFSGFAGVLPSGYTYADYARQGFFQLAVVSIINAIVLGFTAATARRSTSGYPKALRVLGAVLAVETLALIAVSASKMLLYVRAYGLTELRLYTLWYLAVAFVVVGFVGARHLRRFAVDRAVIITVLAGFLVLAFGNADGVIARYNVDGYLAGTQQADVDYLSTGLSDAALPQLARLADQAPDADVSAQAAAAVQDYRAGCFAVDGASALPWTAWNWQTQTARQAAGC